MPEFPTTIKMSEQFGQLFGALAKAKLNYKAVVRTRENPFTNSKYADLQDLTDATQVALATEGLAVAHLPLENIEHKKAGAVSILGHSSGEFLSVELWLPAIGLASGGKEKFDAQTSGAAITYAKRYNYQGLTGVVGEEEDDGNSISTERESGAPKKTAPKTAAASAPQMDKNPGKDGGSRPERAATSSRGPSEAPVAAPAAPQANDNPQGEVTPTPASDSKSDGGSPETVPTASESATSTVSQPAISGDKPTKSQFDTYTARAVALKQPLEKAGLKPSKGFQTGAKLKNYLLKTTGAKELTELTIMQWEGFFATFEPQVASDPASVVKSIEESIS